MTRIQDLGEFWPHYLREHADPTTRVLHFIGTSGFLASVTASFYFEPFVTAVAAGMSALALAFSARYLEPKRAAFVPGALVIGILVAAMPSIMPFGIVFAYLCAWVGHFNFEGNKPATFRYPVWSLLCDLRMYGNMCMGQLWSGDPSRSALKSA